MRQLVVLVAVVLALFAGSAIAQPEPQAAATDRAAVKELRAIKNELRTLNANVGSRFRDEPVITQLSSIKQSTKRTCENTASSSFTPCE